MNDDTFAPRSPGHARSRRHVPHDHRDGRTWRHDLLAGGPEGNERLTVLCGLLLIVLLAGLGVTILQVSRLLWLHIFLGCVLVGPIALKLSSTGYRLGRYYTADPHYRTKGPPPLGLRALAPLVVFFTFAVFATGGAMLLLGPSSRGSLLILHKASFLGWIGVVAVHVLAHLPDLLRWARGTLRLRQEPLGSRRVAAARVAPMPGRTGRGAVLIAALFGGLVLAITLSSEISAFAHTVLSR